MSPLAPLGLNCSSCDCRVVVNSPTSNPRMGTSTTGRSTYVVQMYTCCQSSQRILGAFYALAGRLVVFSPLSQNNTGRLDQGRETNA